MCDDLQFALRQLESAECMAAAPSLDARVHRESFTGPAGDAGGTHRIDWILARGKVTVDAEEIETFSRDGHFPSDHCPVVAWLRLGE